MSVQMSCNYLCTCLSVICVVRQMIRRRVKQLEPVFRRELFPNDGTPTQLLLQKCCTTSVALGKRMLHGICRILQNCERSLFFISPDAVLRVRLGLWSRYSYGLYSHGLYSGLHGYGPYIASASASGADVVMALAGYGLYSHGPYIASASASETHFSARRIACAASSSSALCRAPACRAP